MTFIHEMLHIPPYSYLEGYFWGVSQNVDYVQLILAAILKNGFKHICIRAYDIFFQQHFLWKSSHWEHLHSEINVLILTTLKDEISGFIKLALYAHGNIQVMFWIWKWNACSAYKTEGINVCSSLVSCLNSKPQHLTSDFWHLTTGFISRSV